MEKKSFIYTISSTEKINNQFDRYDINIGGFNSSYNNYKCEVLSLILDENYLQTNGYLLLVADNFAQDGYFCRSKLPSTETIVSHVAINPNITPSSGGNIFPMSNLRTTRMVTFRFLLPNLTPTVDEVDLNINEEITFWLLTLKMTEID